MGPKTAELVKVLSTLEALLSNHGETKWSHHIGQSRSLIEGSDFRGVKLLLSAYGGMGSLNDLILEPSEGGISEVDEEFRQLTSKAFELGNTIEREVRNG